MIEIGLPYLHLNRESATLSEGVIVTELAFMDPIVTECEACFGTRYKQEALACLYKGKNIVEILKMTAQEALEFFEDAKITRSLKLMEQVGLSYLTLGQPLSTLSGGERQRIKLAKNLGKKGSIIIMDEPTTGLHMSDIQKPDGGKNGGEVVFQGTVQDMINNANTLTADCLKKLG